MVVIVVVMLGVLLIAGIVVLYVAYPHRGEDVPGAPWLGAALTRAADAVPTLDADADADADQDEDEDEDDQGRLLR